jgi:predicted MFS family arabinose efflux permease
LPAYAAVLAARAVAGLGGAMIVPVSAGVAAGLVVLPRQVG